MFAQNLKKIFSIEVAEALQYQPQPKIITENDILHLPDLVQKYLKYTGVIGKEQVFNIKLEFQGQFKTTPTGKFSQFQSTQYNVFGSYIRLFYMKMHMMGLPLHGLHVYKNTTASMVINLGRLFNLVDGKGSKMDQGETVTVLNDMCCMAPATLINAPIEWQTIDSHSVKATLTNGDISVSAFLYFNETGQLINFVSYDRYLSTDGKSFLNYPWSTPLKDYKEFDGRLVPTYGEAIWDTPEGHYVYGKFHLRNVHFNCN